MAKKLILKRVKGKQVEEWVDIPFVPQPPPAKAPEIDIRDLVNVVAFLKGNGSIA